MSQNQQIAAQQVFIVQQMINESKRIGISQDARTLFEKIAIASGLQYCIIHYQIMDLANSWNKVRVNSALNELLKSKLIIQQPLIHHARTYILNPRYLDNIIKRPVVRSRQELRQSLRLVVNNTI